MRNLFSFLLVVFLLSFTTFSWSEEPEIIGVKEGWMGLKTSKYIVWRTYTESIEESLVASCSLKGGVLFNIVAEKKFTSGVLKYKFGPKGKVQILEAFVEEGILYIGYIPSEMDDEAKEFAFEDLVGRFPFYENEKLYIEAETEEGYHIMIFDIQGYSKLQEVFINPCIKEELYE